MPLWEIDIDKVAPRGPLQRKKTALNVHIRALMSHLKIEKTGLLGGSSSGGRRDAALSLPNALEDLLASMCVMVKEFVVTP